MAISHLFVSTCTSVIAPNSSPLTTQKALDTCDNILLIGAPCCKEWPIFNTHRNKIIDHIDTYWLRNADLNDRIRQALTHHRYDAVVCCNEPLAPWMNLTEEEANDAASLITASGYTLQMGNGDHLRHTAMARDTSLEA